MQMFTGQSGSGFTSDGIKGKILLQFVIRIVRNVADPAAVDDGRLFFFSQKPVEFHVVAGSDNQRVDGPFKPVNFN